MNTTSFKKNLLVKIVLLPLLLSLTGCIYLVVGGVGALGGYIVSPDTVEGLTDNDEVAVWDAAVEILSIMGTIEEEQEDAGIIFGKVNGANVTITILPVNQATVKLSVKSRKHYLPKISVSQDVFVKIMGQLNEE